MLLLLKIPLREIEEFEREIVHLGAKFFDALNVLVVRDDGRDGGKEAGSSSDQSF